MDLLTERALVWAFGAFESRSSLRRKLAGTVVFVPLGAFYCAGLIAHAIWTTEAEVRDTEPPKERTADG